MPTDREDELLSASELARRAGISPRTIANWAMLVDHPLESVSGPRGRRTYTVAQLRAFCTARTDLSAARRALRRLDPPDQDTAETPIDHRSAVRNLRVAAQAALEVATSAARQAEQNAAAHREQVDALALMIRSYDDLLTQLTAPATPP